MADQYPVTPAPGRPVGTPAPAPAPAVQRPPRFPDDPDAARAEIAATRARMSETIDEIEDVLIRKKEEIRDRLDVMDPVREQPLRSLAMVFGAALVLGFLTGGSKRKHTEVRYVLAEGRLQADDDEDADEDEDEMEPAYEEPEEDPAALAWERAEQWEDRAHRLLRIAQVQESELELHRSRRSELRDRLRALRGAEREQESFDPDDDEEYAGPNLFDRVRTTAAARIAALADDVSHRMMRGS